MIEETIAELIEFLKNASPEIWATLIKQVYAEATVKMVWALVFALVSFLAFRFISNRKANGDELEDYWPFWLASWSAAIAAIYMLTDAVMWFYNPEFYAIRFLLDKLTGSY